MMTSTVLLRQLIKEELHSLRETASAGHSFAEGDSVVVKELDGSTPTKRGRVVRVTATMLEVDMPRELARYRFKRGAWYDGDDRVKIESVAT